MNRILIACIFVLLHSSAHQSVTVLCLAYALIIAAIARPQWGSEEQPTFSKGRTVMLAIDASRSMLAQDLTPNRLDRAKLAAYDLIEALPDDLLRWQRKPVNQFTAKNQQLLL